MDRIGKKLLDVAEAQLGYREKADGYTKFGEWYAKNVDDGDSYFYTAPWCDMFIAWAADKAGLQDSVGQFASTVKHAKWFKKEGAWGHKPEPGAIVFFDWSGSSDIDQIDHVGIVEKVHKDGTLTTIEANVDGVHLKRKTRTEGDIVGYGYPSKVKLETKPETEKYVPKHAAPPPKTEELTDSGTSGGVAGTRKDAPNAGENILTAHEAVLGSLLAVVLFGSVALAVTKSAAAKLPAEAPVRVRKRGKHHRTGARPVALPADVTPADLADADNATTIMPALSMAAAAEAEDREFWGRVATFSDDEELAFWDALHAEFSRPPKQHRRPTREELPWPPPAVPSRSAW